MFMVVTPFFKKLVAVLTFFFGRSGLRCCSFCCLPYSLLFIVHYYFKPKKRCHKENGAYKVKISAGGRVIVNY